MNVVNNLYLEINHSLVFMDVYQTVNGLMKEFGLIMKAMKLICLKNK